MEQLGQSDWIIQATLWALIAASALTWTILLYKGWQQAAIGHANRKFRNAFWNAPDLAMARRVEVRSSSLGRVASAGFSALDAVASPATRRLSESGEATEILERTLRQQIQRERNNLEQGLTILASIGSTAPFVGLFGTVWGIMHALTEIGKSGAAGLDVVAGPVGEALIATAIGIAAAIPAVLGYNFFLRRVKLVEAELEYFATDFLHLALRNRYTLKQGEEEH